MVNKKLIDDLMFFNIPVLCCGDPGQLPPPDGLNNNLLNTPDAFLTEIVRQEEENVLIKIATMARNKIYIKPGNYGNVIVLNKNSLSIDEMTKIFIQANQVLCGTNEKRNYFNKLIKKELGLNLTSINKGEKVICLLNNWSKILEPSFPLVNGIIGNVINFSIDNEEDHLGIMSFKPDFTDSITEDILFDTEIFESGIFKNEFYELAYLMDSGRYERKIVMSKEHSKEELKKFVNQKIHAVNSEQINFFDSAYCISVHKSQGSEWDNVVIYDESFLFGKDSSKWLYTAITRAKKKIVLIK